MSIVNGLILLEVKLKADIMNMAKKKPIKKTSKKIKRKKIISGYYFDGRRLKTLYEKRT